MVWKDVIGMDIKVFYNKFVFFFWVNCDKNFGFNLLGKYYSCLINIFCGWVNENSFVFLKFGIVIERNVGGYKLSGKWSSCFKIYVFRNVNGIGLVNFGMVFVVFFE